jgi:hypothetical protein
MRTISPASVRCGTRLRYLLQLPYYSARIQFEPA